MAIYCGVDFHARQQTVCYCDTVDGVIQLAELDHQADDVRGFYSRFAGEVIVGIEASGYSTWFAELLEGLGHRVLVGDAAEVRRLAKRRQKNDRRDAGLILDLLLRGEFPQVHRPPFESREVLRLLRYRHKLVQMRTRAKNSLQALAFSAGSSGRSRLLSRAGRERFLQLTMSEAMGRQREGWLSLVDDLNARIKGVDAWLDERAKRDERVLRLQTHPGIGLLTSLALVHALKPVTRFAGGRKVAAYVGLTPAQHSSGDVVRMGRITRSGKNSLRGTLVEAAWRMISKDSTMCNQYEQLKARSGAKRAIVAIARRLLLRARRMLLDGRAYVAEPAAA